MFIIIGMGSSRLLFMKRHVFSQVSISAFIILYLAVALYADTKKKLFVNNITPESGVSKKLAVKIRDQLTLSIFENFSDRYQIVTDEDISVMYEKASKMMATGSESESAVKQVANAINADEIIYGRISMDGGKLRFSVQNLERKSSDNSVRKKSFVNLSFFEGALEWYCREIAKKLVNPGYRIDTSRAISKIIPKFEVGDIGIKSFSGTKIRKIRFEGKDEITSKILKELKPIVKEGDEYYKEEDYDDALDEYRKVLRIIGKKLRKGTQKKIEPFIKSIINRIAAVHSMDVQKDIKKVDNYIKSKKPLTIDILKTGKRNYEKIARPLLKLPAHEKEGLSKVLGAIEDRLTSIFLSWISIYEEQADALYSNYQFKKALKTYKGAIDVIDNATVKNKKMSSVKSRISKKRDITVATGGSYLENLVVSYCNAAEYLNMKGDRWDARKYLKKTKTIITRNKEFANQRMADIYKDTARLLK